MVREFYRITARPLSLTPDPVCYFDPARINQIAKRLLVRAAVSQQDHVEDAQPDQWHGGAGDPQPRPIPPIPREAASACCESQIAGSRQMHLQPVQEPDHAALLDRLNSLESRMIEQERTIRHTMTILIEWIERDEAQVLVA